MKRLTILFMLFLTSCMLYAKDRKGNDLSGPIALKGELTEKYQNYTKGTPVVIRGVRKMRISPDETAGITYAVEIDGLQYPVGAEEAGKIIRLKPATSRAETRAKRAAFWADVLGTVAMAADDTNWMYGYDERVGAIELVASIGTIAALINVRTVNRLGMDYSSKQELQADRIARDYLAFKGMNPNALSSAINKIKEFYALPNWEKPKAYTAICLRK